jgi:glycosyltransferase involved in cell wall biosynthesis
MGANCRPVLWAARRPEGWGPLERVRGVVREPRLLRLVGSSFRSGPVRSIARALAYWADVKSLPKLAQECDVVHIQWLVLLPVTSAEIKTLLRFRIRGKPLVYTAHNPVSHESASKPALERYRRAYEAADAIIVHAQANRERLLELFPVEPQKVHVVPMGPMHDTDGGSSPRADAPKGQAGAGFLLLQFGVVRPYKGTEVLLQAMPYVRSRFPNARLLVAGRALGDIGSRLLNLRDSLGLGDSCSLRFAYVPDRELEALIDQADVVVFPYVEASQSAAVISAMSRGRPVVASAVGGIPEVIRDGVDGYLVPPGDVKSLAEKIIQVLNDPRRGEVGRQAYQRVHQNFGWADAARRTVAIYTKVIEEVRTHPR